MDWILISKKNAFDHFVFTIFSLGYSNFRYAGSFVETFPNMEK